MSLWHKYTSNLVMLMALCSSSVVILSIDNEKATHFFEANLYVLAIE